jgi:hypothetical protein
MTLGGDKMLLAPSPAARAFGLEAVGTDLVKRAPFIAGGRDFLSPKYKAPRGPVSIVSNPPFSRMREFVERSLEVSTGKVALLFPSHRTGAARWLRDFPLTRILHVSPRPSLWHGKEYLRRTNAGEKLGNGSGMSRGSFSSPARLTSARRIGCSEEARDEAAGGYRLGARGHLRDGARHGRRDGLGALARPLAGAPDAARDRP